MIEIRDENGQLVTESDIFEHDVSLSIPMFVSIYIIYRYDVTNSSVGRTTDSESEGQLFKSHWNLQILSVIVDTRQ